MLPGYPADRETRAAQAVKVRPVPTSFSANVEKALTFLDDRLLGATSNAVERANRRYRKMQKSVYRVRTFEHIVDRLALDLFREAAMLSRTATLGRLHTERAGP